MILHGVFFEATTFMILSTRSYSEKREKWKLVARKVNACCASDICLSPNNSQLSNVVTILSITFLTSFPKL